MNELSNIINSQENTDNRSKSSIKNIISKFKGKFGESNIILIASLLPYFITYYYQTGYLHYYGISSDFIDFSFQTLFKDTVLAILIALLTGIIISNIVLIPIEFHVKSMLKISFEFSFNLFMLVIICLLGSDSFNSHILLTSLIVFAVLLISFCIMTTIVLSLNFLYAKISNQFKVKETTDKSATKNKTNANTSNIWVVPIAIIVFIIFQIIFSLFGEATAKMKTSYMSFNGSDNNTYLIVANYKEGVMAVQYDKKENKLRNSSKYFDIKDTNIMSSINIEGLKKASDIPWSSFY